MKRVLIGLGLGGVVTFLLFILMAYLVKSELEPPPKEESISIQIGMVEPDDNLRLRQRQAPKPPEPPKEPPPPEPKRIVKVKPKLDASINMDVNVNVTGDVFVGGAMTDGEAIPMVIIQPMYPRKAAMEGIEGWVRFEFTVSPDGSPKDIRVIDAEPKRVFERDARKAIYKWKFKPKVVDGKPVEQPNMRYTMEFKLSQ